MQVSSYGYVHVMAATADKVYPHHHDHGPGYLWDYYPFYSCASTFGYRCFSVVLADSTSHADDTISYTANPHADDRRLCSFPPRIVAVAICSGDESSGCRRL